MYHFTSFIRAASAIALLIAAGLASPAQAASNVAIVEAVGGAPAGVQTFDYLMAGRVIHLGAGGSLVVDYLGSCVRESVSGGTLRVGIDESEVAGGVVTRQRVDCDGPRLRYQSKLELLPGTVYFSALVKPRGQPGSVGFPRTLFGRSPLFDLGGEGRLVIERLTPSDPHLEIKLVDGKLVEIPPGHWDPPIVIDIKASDLARGRFYDFAQVGRSLEAGEYYRARFGEREAVFLVDPLAPAGATALAGRLLLLTQSHGKSAPRSREPGGRGIEPRGWRLDGHSRQLIPPYTGT